MADQPQSPPTPPKPEELAKAFAEIAVHSQRVVNQFLKRQSIRSSSAASSWARSLDGRYRQV